VTPVDITYSLHLPRDEVSVPIVRHLSRQALSDLGVAEDFVSDIEVAVTEACTNVLKHAKGENEPYDVEVEVHDATCIIRVIDRGAEFGKRARDHKGLTAEGGRGIYLMRALVDQLHFESRPEEGTVVRIEKRLSFKDNSILGDRSLRP
jgi:serine/threonine-protein kinase RsbW